MLQWVNERASLVPEARCRNKRVETEALRRLKGDEAGLWWRELRTSMSCIKDHIKVASCWSAPNRLARVVVHRQEKQTRMGIEALVAREGKPLGSLSTDVREPRTATGS